jgi:hypothetical protein
VTVKVLSTGPVLVEQPRVLDQQSLERQVTEQVPGGEVKELACPTAVQVEVGRSFECRYWGETNPGTAKVEITDDQGTLSISTG